MYHSRHPKRNIGIFLRPFSTKYFVSRFYIAKPTGTGVPPTAASSTRITKPYYRDGAQRGPTPIITILSHIMTRTLFFIPPASHGSLSYQACGCPGHITKRHNGAGAIGGPHRPRLLSPTMICMTLFQWHFGTQRSTPCRECSSFYVAYLSGMVG